MRIKKQKAFVARTSLVSSYLKEVEKTKVLTASEERDLIERIRKGDEEARHTLIKANQRFVFAVAKMYATDDKVMDLVNEGNIGLMYAIDTFKPSKNTRFLSYAVWYIRREINAYLLNENLLIKRSNLNKTLKVGKIREKFYVTNGRYPTEDEIREILEKEHGIKLNSNLDVTDIKIDSINTCFDDDDSFAFENSPIFTNATASYNEYEKTMDKENLSEIISKVTSVLDEREKKVIELSYGIGHERECNNDEVAALMNLSTERVRQIQKSAMKKLRSAYLSLN